MNSFSYLDGTPGAYTHIYIYILTYVYKYVHIYVLLLIYENYKIQREFVDIIKNDNDLEDTLLYHICFASLLIENNGELVAVYS